MRQHRDGQQAQSRSLVLNAGLAATVLATGLGVVADVDALFGISRVLLASIAGIVGLGALGLGLVLYARQWSKPLGWPATKGTLWAAAGLLLCTVSAVAIVPEMVTRGSNAPASSAPMSLSTARDENQDDLDPVSRKYRPDIQLDSGPVLRRAFVDEGYDGTWAGPTLFVQVAGATSQACGAAKGWLDRIEPVQDQLICVKTDQGRYVVIEILSASERLISYRVVHVQPLPSDSARAAP